MAHNGGDLQLCHSDPKCGVFIDNFVMETLQINQMRLQQGGTVWEQRPLRYEEEF